AVRCWSAGPGSPSRARHGAARGGGSGRGHRLSQQMDTTVPSAPGLLFVEEGALERLEDSAPVSGRASLSVSPKHLVRLWGDEEGKDIGGFLDAEIRVESSMGVERLGDQG